MSNIVSIARNHNKIFLGTYQYFMYISISSISTLHLCSWCRSFRTENLDSCVRLLVLFVLESCLRHALVYSFNFHWEVFDITQVLGSLKKSLHWLSWTMCSTAQVCVPWVSWGLHVCRWNWKLWKKLEEFSHSIRLLKVGRLSPQLAHLEGKSFLLVFRTSFALRSTCWVLKLEVWRSHQ